MLTGTRILGTSSLRRNSIAPGLKDAMRPWRNVHFRRLVAGRCLECAWVPISSDEALVSDSASYSVDFAWLLGEKSLGGYYWDPPSTTGIQLSWSGWGRNRGQEARGDSANNNACYHIDMSWGMTAWLELGEVCHPTLPDEG